MGEVLHEVSVELWNEGATPVSSDEEALKSLRRVSEDTAENVRSLQQSIVGRQRQEELQEERLLYKEVKPTNHTQFCRSCLLYSVWCAFDQYSSVFQIGFTHKQREIAAEAWRNYVARTSNYSVLKV